VYLVLKWLSRLLAALPLPACRFLGRCLGDLAYLLVRRHRATVLAEMQRCFPDESPVVLRARLRRVYQGMAMNYVEVFRWMGGGDAELDARVRVEGREHFEAAVARGRGALVLTAHTGNWDLMGLWAARRYPLTIISKDLRQAGVNRFWMEARQRFGLKIVPAHNSYRSCLQVLRRKEVLGFILDQNMTRMEGIFVDFFGKPACTTPGLAFLAAHAQAPVVPCFMLRDPDGWHRLLIGPPLDPPADRQPATIQAATQHYTRLIEDVIRRHPDQWIWMHRRWRTVPLPVERTPADGV
jgi:KDO2-lipid IV(A) lauroyltransferase